MWLLFVNNNKIRRNAMLFRRKLNIFFSQGLFIMFVLLWLTSMSLAQGDTWTKKAPMPTARSLLSTSAVNDKIYAIGGKSGGIGSSVVEQYDPVTDTWTTKTSMPTARQWLSTSAVNGKIYAIGGNTQAGAPSLATVEEYNPATDTWTKKADMPTARFALSTSVVDGKIYAIGGALDPGGQGLRTVEMYDPVTNIWSIKPSMLTRRATFLSTSTVNGIIYVIGGVTGHTSIATVEAYDPANDTWTEKTSMPIANGFLSTSVVNGMIYAIGGTPYGSAVREYEPPITSVDDPFGEQNNPMEFVLHQNYPNPFNPATTIVYSIPKQDFVTLKVYDLLGNEIQTLVRDFVNIGRYSVTFDANKFASGLYFYKLQAGDLVNTRKMLLIR